jgi:hypothetical protein
MLAASLYLLYSRWRRFAHALPPSSYRVLAIFCGIFLCGSVAFMLNLVFAWSRFGEAKDPVTQFATQSLLLLIVPVIVVTHAELFAEGRWYSFTIKVLPWAAFLHLAVTAINAMHWLDPASLPLSLFRNNEFSSRISGLMSEPSYVGTMAAIYGLPLLMVRPKGRQYMHVILAILFFSMAIYANAKTVIPVALCGFLGYVWYSRVYRLTPKRIAAALCVTGLSVAVIVSNSTFDLQENLSSAMRIGSTITALNAAIAGYGITGVGLGQFHFMYVPQFMPKFLLLSKEALMGMSSTSEQRASTYNVFARYWIETGAAGLLFFLALLRYLFKVGRDDHRPGSLLGVLLIATSLGFLMTQDPYCYPPILLGAALVLGTHNDPLPLPAARLEGKT